MVESVVKSPTMIRVTLLCGRPSVSGLSLICPARGGKPEDYWKRSFQKNKTCVSTVSMAMPSDSCCEKKFEIVLEIVFQIAGAKL